MACQGFAFWFQRVCLTKVAAQTGISWIEAEVLTCLMDDQLKTLPLHS